MGVELLTQHNYTSKSTCDNSKRVYAGTQVQSCESLPGGAEQCDGFYVCDSTQKNCNPCQSYASSTGKNLNRTSGSQYASCMPMSGNCNDGFY